jgi:tetratricopeptide (TPR) repeat protein
MPRSSEIVTAALLTSLWVGSISACGGPSEDDLRRSEAEYDLGRGLWEEQNVAGAFQHLQESVRLDADNADAHLLLGNLFLFRVGGGQNDAERTASFEQSEHHFHEALRANAALGRAGRPALNAEAKNSLGVLYIHWSRYDDAVRVLREATGDLMNHRPYFAWGNLGWAYFEQQDFAQALPALEQSVQLNPGFCNGWFRMGQVHFAQGRDAQADAGRESFERAEDALTSALENEDESCQRLQEAWRLRGETRARLGRRDDAVADFERCIELASDTEAGRTCAAMLESTP